MLKKFVLVFAFILLGNQQLLAQSTQDTNYIIVFYGHTNYGKRIPIPSVILLDSTPIKFRYGSYFPKPEKQYGKLIKCINDSQALIENEKSTDTLLIDSFLMFKTHYEYKYPMQAIGVIFGLTLHYLALDRLANCQNCTDLYSQLVNFVEVGLIGSLGNICIITAYSFKQKGMNIANGLIIDTYPIPKSVTLDSKSVKSYIIKNEKAKKRERKVLKRRKRDGYTG